jgi:hypothetical protein
MLYQASRRRLSTLSCHEPGIFFSFEKTSGKLEKAFQPGTSETSIFLGKSTIYQRYADNSSQLETESYKTVIFCGNKVQKQAIFLLQKSPLPGLIK